jgi:hypothetical protein
MNPRARAGAVLPRSGGSAVASGSSMQRRMGILRQYLVLCALFAGITSARGATLEVYHP